MSLTKNGVNKKNNIVNIWLIKHSVLVYLIFNNLIVDWTTDFQVDLISKQLVFLLPGGSINNVKALIMD